MSTPEQLQAIIPVLAAGVLAFALVLMLAALRLFRKSRKDIYWRQRRTAGQRGWRLFVWSIGLVVVAGVLCAATSVAGLLYSHPTKTPTAVANAGSPLDVVTLTATRPAPGPSATLTTLPPSSTATHTAIPPTAPPTITPTATQPPPTQPTITPTVSITAVSPPAIPTVIPTTPPGTEITIASTITLTETFVLSATPTEMPTETPTELSTTTLTPIASATLTVTPTSSATLFGAATVLESSVTPNPDARITINALDTQISGDFGPVKPATSFSAGFTRIYYFVTFSGMEKGVLWRRELLLDDQIIQSNQYLWGLTQGGTAYFFFGQEEGFKPGSYRINVYIGGSTKPTGTSAFTVS